MVAFLCGAHRRVGISCSSDQLTLFECGKQDVNDIDPVDPMGSEFLYTVVFQDMPQSSAFIPSSSHTILSSGSLAILTTRAGLILWP